MTEHESGAHDGDDRHYRFHEVLSVAGVTVVGYPGASKQRTPEVKNMQYFSRNGA
jgi:hypothetical protein